jgi:hypothetical protein
VAQYNTWVSGFVTAFREEEDPEEKLKELQDYPEEALQAILPFREHSMLLSRRLFLGGKGYLGLGPGSTQSGDEVWILETARMPFIMRPVRQQQPGENDDDVDDVDPEKRYQLIGECHVLGSMHQELFKGQSKNMMNMMTKMQGGGPKFEDVEII